MLGTSVWPKVFVFLWGWMRHSFAHGVSSYTGFVGGQPLCSERVSGRGIGVFVGVGASFIRSRGELLHGICRRPAFMLGMSVWPKVFVFLWGGGCVIYSLWHPFRA